MTEKYLQFLQPHVRAIKLVNGQPYALMQNEQRGYVFNLETKQKLQVTSNTFTFNATATGIYFFKFPNRVLALINPVTSQITMLRARPSDHRNDLIFVSGNKPYILLHQQTTVVFPNNENVAYCPATGAPVVAPDLRDALMLRNWVFCANIVIKYDKALSVFEYYACPKDTKVQAALDRLRTTNRIQDDFYDNGALLAAEVQTLLNAYEATGERAVSPSAQINAPFTSICEDQITYGGAVLGVLPYDRTVAASSSKQEAAKKDASGKAKESRHIYQNYKNKAQNSTALVKHIYWSQVNDVVVYSGNSEVACYQRVGMAKQVARMWTIVCDEEIVYLAGASEHRQTVKSLVEEQAVAKDLTFLGDRIARFESLRLHELLKRCEKEFVDTGDAASWLFNYLVMGMKAFK